MQEDNLDRVMNDLLLTLSSDEDKRVQAETNLARVCLRHSLVLSLASHA
jgi:hypothetical protein